MAKRSIPILVTGLVVLILDLTQLRVPVFLTRDQGEVLRLPALESGVIERAVYFRLEDGACSV